MAQYKRFQREQLKESCIAYIGGKICKICGNNYEHISSYQFHHCKGVKKEDISKMLSRKNKMDDELREELDKCILVCANHHAQITARILNIANI